MPGPCCYATELRSCLSPNHKTAADAIRATPQKAKNRRQNDRGDEAVQPIHQPTMSGNKVARILDVEVPFHRRLEKVPKLGSHGERRCQQQQPLHFQHQQRIRLVRIEDKDGVEIKRQGGELPIPLADGAEIMEEINRISNEASQAFDKKKAKP